MSTPARRLLLHGFTGGADDWSVIFPGDRACLAVDLPGHGAAPDADASYLEIMRALLERIPPTIDEIVGYSFGGRIALSLIQLAPDRFRAATLISAHPGLLDPALRAQRRLADQGWIRMLRERGLPAFVDAWERQPLFRTQSRLPPDVLARQRQRRLSHRPEGLASAIERLGLAEMPSAWDGIEGYRGRLTWIVGGEDSRFRAIAQEVAALRPATRLRLLDGVGHNPLLETPERLRDELG